MDVAAIARLFVLAALLAGATQLRAEEKCTLKIAADLELLDNSGGVPVVPVIFRGRPAKMILDTGAYWSGIVPSAASGLKTQKLTYIGLVGAGGGVLRTAAKVPELKIGNIPLVGADFFVLARDNAEDPDLIGNIGANILKAYDVEIDYPGRRVKLYLQDHCPGRVVSWQHGDLVKIPFALNEVGHISLPVTLDGHDYRALLDTGAAASYLDKKIADRDFGLTAETANAMGVSDTLDGKDLPTFYHKFGLLDLGGLQFNAPQLAFSIGQEEGGGWRREEVPSLILGIHQLRKLHLYIAYGEKMIYASAASTGPLPLDSIDRVEAGRHSDKAEAQLAAGDYAGAAASLTEALRAAPDEASLHVARAFALIKSGDYASAIADLGRAHELAPADPSILSDLAYAHVNSGDPAAAIEDLGDLLALDPKSAVALTGRCSLKIGLNQFDGALADCEQAIALDPGQHEARLARAFLHMRRAEWDPAVADCDAVLAEDPSSETAQSYLDQIRRARAVAGAPAKGKAKPAAAVPSPPARSGG